MDNKNILYVLTIDCDLSDYYYHKYGEGAFDALTPEQQRQLARSAERGIGEGVGEVLDVAFDYAIEDLEREG